jgi:hypothetical protein
MTTNTPIKKPRRCKLKITHDNVIQGLECAYELYGLDTVKLMFQVMNVMYVELPGWAETSVEIQQYLIRKSNEQQQKLHDEKMEELLAGASKTLLLNLIRNENSNTNENNNEASGFRQVDQLNLADIIKEITHTKKE